MLKGHNSWPRIGTREKPYEEKLVIPETVSSSAKVSRHTVGRRRVNDRGRERSAQAEAVLCSADKG